MFRRRFEGGEGEDSRQTLTSISVVVRRDEAGRRDVNACRLVFWSDDKAKSEAKRESSFDLRRRG